MSVFIHATQKPKIPFTKVLSIVKKKQLHKKLNKN